MKSIKNHFGVKIKFDKYIANPAKVPKSAYIKDVFYDENYDIFTLYRTPADKLYIRHSDRRLAKQKEIDFNQ
jgi:hypothetical protein